MQVLPGCSISIGSDEGYGSKRICISCNLIEGKKTQSQEAMAMNLTEKWGPKKNNRKQSRYMQNNPAFDLFNNTKKTKIGIFKNYALSKKSTKINGKSVHFSNSSAFDSIAQAFAGAYAYYPFYQQCIENQESNELMDIAILLSKKYAFLLIIISILFRLFAFIIMS